jgi:hypothetical protein
MADEDEEQTRKIPTRQDVRDYTKAQDEAARQRERAKDKLASGSNIVSHEAQTKRREAEAQQNVFDATYDAALKRGASQEQASAAADQAVTDSGIGSITPNLDRAAADNRKLAASRAADYEAAKNKALKEGLNKFQSDVGKSMTFGEESALLTPEGRQRALKAAVKSGYSFDEADSMVQGAFKKLQEVGKRENWKGFGSNVDVPVAVPPLLARPEETAAPAAPAGPTKPDGSPSTPPTKIKTEEGKPEYGPADMAQELVEGLQLKELPEGAAGKVRSAFDALSALKQTPRVTDEERERLKDLKNKATLDPAFSEDYSKSQSDIASRDKLYDVYDVTREALIKDISKSAPVSSPQPNPTSPYNIGGTQQIPQAYGREEETRQKVNRLFRAKRESQY